MHRLIKYYFRYFSLLFPKNAAMQAFNLFQRTRPFSKRFRKRELIFYKNAHSFRVPGIPEDTIAYELGNPKGELVILVHGWDSNAGSMGMIAAALASQGNRVIALDLPAHGNSKLKKANIMLCRESLRNLVHFINPSKPFNLITHSFGSAVAAYTFWRSTYSLKSWYMLSSPDNLQDLFMEFKNGIGLSNKSYNYLEALGNEILNERISSLSVANWLKEIKVESVEIIHNRKDKILPYTNSENIKKENPFVRLSSLSGIGHYKMLNAPEVIKKLVVINSKNSSGSVEYKKNIVGLLEMA